MSSLLSFNVRMKLLPRPSRVAARGLPTCARHLLMRVIIDSALVACNREDEMEEMLIRGGRPSGIYVRISHAVMSRSGHRLGRLGREASPHPVNIINHRANMSPVRENRLDDSLWLLRDRRNASAYAGDRRRR